MDNKQRADALIARANQYQQVGQINEAIAAYEEAIDLFDGYRPFRFVVADMLWRAERIDEAAEVYRQVVKDSPGHDQAWERLGEYHMRQGNHPEAAAALDRAVEANPESGLALYYGAMVHTLLDHPDVAQDYLQRALALHPRWAAQARKDPLLSRYV